MMEIFKLAHKKWWKLSPACLLLLTLCISKQRQAKQTELFACKEKGTKVK